jgi:Rieske Fe-S protein
MNDPARLTRRSLFAVTGAAAGVSVLAACSTSPGEANGAGSGAEPSAPSGGKDGVFALSSIPVGGGISATFKGAPIVLEQPKAGTVVVFSAVCPHQGCVVAPADAQFNCPCHGSVFDGATGAVTHGPARTGLTKLTAAVDGDAVTVS